MAKIPDYNPVLADTRVLGAAHADGGISPGLAAIPGQQMQQFGGALVGASDAALRIATQMQQDINQTQVDDALNKAREATLKLTYDPDEGYAGIKGNDALTRPSGQSLPDEFGGKLQKTIDDLSTGLSNDEQRRQFSLRANDIATSFKGNVEAHMLQEFKSYSLSVQDGAVKLGQDEAKRNWSDPVKVDTALSSVAAAVARAGKIQGKSGNQIMSEMQAATSMVHLGVIEAALAAGNSTSAMAHLEKNKASMTADDILRVNGVLIGTLNHQQAAAAVGQTTQEFKHVFAPTDAIRLQDIVKQLESGGNPNAVGPNVPGQGTAKGSMQVMDATNSNPGFGVKPAKDDSPEERARVGRDYLQALVSKFGSAAQALAAYNAGPGKEGTNGYDKDGKPLPGLLPAMARADAKGSPQNWLSELPKETQAYVQNGMAKFGAGQGAPSIPTEFEFIEKAMSKIGPNASPALQQLTRAAAEQQYGIITKSIKEKADNVFLQAQQEMIANGGNYNGMSLATRQAMAQFAPGKMDDLALFAKRIARGDNETDASVYMKLATYPDEMAKLSDAEFMQLRTKLSESDFKHFSNERADILNGKTDDTSGGINSKSINTALNNRLTSIGINPTPGSKDMAARQQVGTIQKYVRDDIFAQQAQLGRKLTPAEVEQRIDALFAKDVNFRSTFLGIGYRSTQQPMLSLKVSDIPPDSLMQLRKQLATKGFTNPTDDQILRIYWDHKNGR